MTCNKCHQPMLRGEYDGKPCYGCRTCGAIVQIPMAGATTQHSSKSRSATTRDESAAAPARVYRQENVRTDWANGNTPAANPGGVRQIVLEFPLPPENCSPNSKDYGRWPIVAKARREYKGECLNMMPLVSLMFTEATITTEWFLASAPGRYHPRDEQNAAASLKSLVDAIVDAGYLSNDDSKHLHWGTCVLHASKDSSGRACVVVTLTKDVRT